MIFPVGVWGRKYTMWINFKISFFFSAGGEMSDLKIFARSSHEPTSLTKWHYVTKL